MARFASRAAKDAPQRFYRWTAGANFPRSYDKSIFIAQVCRVCHCSFFCYDCTLCCWEESRLGCIHAIYVAKPAPRLLPAVRPGVLFFPSKCSPSLQLSLPPRSTAAGTGIVPSERASCVWY
jgi:hypothetical protein